MCTRRTLELHTMDNQCQHPIFLDSDDDHLLLDDNNTGSLGCAKCNGNGKGFSRSGMTYSHVSGSSTTSMLVDDQLDSPEDSPLLINDRINSFGHLSIKDFHCHFHHKVPNETSKASRTLCIVSVLCVLFMITEIIGGYIAGSLAVMTDAAHLFSDLIGFFMSLVSIWISKKPPTNNMTFGYYRAEVLGAFLSVLAVWLLAAIFCILAVERIIKQEYQIEVDTMLIVAGLGLLINIIMGGVLHGFCCNTHTHSHGPSSAERSQGTENINIRAAAAHVIGDLVQSVGVLVAAAIIKIFPGAQIADPICTILFSVIVVLATLRVARDSVLLLVEASPGSSKEMLAALRGIAGVKHVHSLHMWSLAPGKEAMAAHLAVDDNCDRDLVLNEATQIVTKKLKTVSCTIQVEAYDHEQMSVCTECQVLQC